MKTLSVLRHAKSSWDDPVARDFDRPLNDRGWRAARCMGRWMKDQALHFDAVVASPAMRIKETIQGVEQGLERPLSAQYDQRIYMASAAGLFDVLGSTEFHVEHLLLIAHSPGLEDMVLRATRGQENRWIRKIEKKYPTAAYARLVFDIDEWSQVDEGLAQLQAFVRPRDLDSDLGPDE